MLVNKNLAKVLWLCFILSGLPTSLQATYYLDTLFPIGLTGLNNTQAYPPYGNPGLDWKWTHDENPDKNEQDLIDTLGINCIGSEDAHPKYLIDWGDGNNENNYLHQICMPSNNSYAQDHPIYIITASYYVDPPRVYMCDTTISCTTFSYDWIDTLTWPNVGAAAMFRSPYRGSGKGIGAMRFSAYDNGGTYNCHGTPTDANWNKFPGDEVWCEAADEAVFNFKNYFDTYDHEQYIWGYNLITEDPAISRHNRYPHYAGDPWHGCWAGVDRIFRGSNTGFNINYDSLESIHGTFPPPDTQTGIRGAEGSTHRMIIAKGGTATMHRGNFDIFASLPDLDAFVIYSHGWCHAEWNYGDQEIFDWFLYGDPDKSQAKGGRHNTAIYFQKYGNNNKAYSDQSRRWISALCLEWWKVTQNGDAAYARRPCPPEIRCATYLSLSRGAKGILFHPWSLNPSKHNIFPSMEIPYTGGQTGDIWIGLRDHNGYPFGDTIHFTYDSNHVLNTGVGDGDPTYWHHPDHRKDYTYSYLAQELIPELKAISDVLMKLDWDSAYSLKTTCGKETSCPLHYVHDVTTTDSGYIDLGFFEPHSPWWDYGKYLMVVNRDGIAQMDTATITLVLDFPTGSKLSVIEIGDPDSFYVLTKSGGYFYLVKDYEPGEGKLFRFYSIKEGEKPKLNLRGECKESAVASGFTQSLSSGGGNPVAVLTWEWVNYKPWDLTKMELWKQNPYDTEWVCAVDTHPTHRRTYTFTYPMPCDSCCVRFLEVGYHVSGDTITWPTELEGVIGTKSNMYMVCCPNDYGGCPDLYTFFYEDTTISPGHVFIENNTILPHSEHYQQIDEDLLRLDVLNDSPDYYYMAIVENSNEITYLDQAKLWVVDHDEGTQVATSADDSIYVYSEMVAPTYCKDNLNNDRLDEVLWEDTLVYAGSANSYLIVKFDEVEWAHTGLLLSMGNWESGPTPLPKDYCSVPQKAGDGTRLAWPTDA